MRVIRDNKIYAQRKDLNLFEYNNPNEFIYLEEASILKLFNILPYTVDYDVINKLSQEEIIEYMKETMDNIKKIVANSTSVLKDNLDNFTENMQIIKLLENTFYDLRSILWQKKGYIKIELPEENKKIK